MADFVTVAEIKAALDVADSSTDALLTATNGAATAMLLDFMSRDPRADDYVERVDGRGLGELLVNQYPINSVSAVAIDGAAVPLDQIDFDRFSIWLKGSGRFPRGRRNVSVNYNAGEDPLPKSIKQAAIYTVRALLTSRKVDLNASGESWQGVSAQAWDPAGPGTVPVAARTLLAPYVRRISV